MHTEKENGSRKCGCADCGRRRFRWRFRSGGKLADLIRGNNLSLQEVREDLHLVGWLEEEGIRVRWTPEDAEWIQTDGTVLNEECPEKGIQTELTASLQAGVFSREYRFPVTLYPPLRTKQQEKEAGFKRLLKQMDEAQRTEGQLVLPKMYEGKNLSYRVRGDREYLLFPVLGIAAAILLPLYEKQKESEAKKKKKRELMEDYPEIVSKLTVFSGAGLPVRRAWERIVLEYEAACRAGTQTERAAYREMAAAYHRMQRGVPELQAYAEFGAGCRLRPYRKLSGLLEQNVRNGAEGLRKALETEMESAFEEEKALARRRGEEASTKLMLPLFLMLMIIMVMVSVPAFLAFGILKMGRKEKKYMDKAYLVREVKSFLMDEDGVGVIELVLILVVLIGLVIVFKKQINTLLTNIFKQINSKSKEVY